LVVDPNCLVACPLFYVFRGLLGHSPSSGVNAYLVSVRQVLIDLHGNAWMC